MPYPLIRHATPPQITIDQSVNTMTQTQMIVFIVLANIMGFGGATLLAAIGGFDFRGVIPAMVLMLFLDVRAILHIRQNTKHAPDDVSAK